MTTTLIRQPAHVSFSAPRGAIWAADFAVAVYRLLERVGANRARKSLHVEAKRWDALDPARAAELRGAEAHLKREAALGSRFL